MNQVCGMWSEPSYTYYQRGEQKCLEQTKRRGRRLSIIGLLQPVVSFVYGLVIGGVNRKSYIQMMEREAQEAEKTGRVRVVVQDNGPIHRWAGSSKAMVKVGKSRFVLILST